MALPPHWLDDHFRGPVHDAGRIADSIARADPFRQAIKAALEARRKSEEAFRNKPNLMAPSPEQAARQAFLNALCPAS